MSDGGILVIGYGNPAREDDGIGPALADIIEEADIPGVNVDIDYQLSVEHAADIARHDIVVFADASVNADEPYDVQRVEPKRTESFSSHSVSPEQALGLAEELFDSKTKGFMLGVRGYSFEMFKETMTEEAAGNLQAAADSLIEALKDRNIEEMMGEKS
ncbi:MAG: hydrogenase maturation protease [Spirochaetales bacterium]|jgi:hydrogenase maturation protease|nr:hydrogenase maturation protease [Spirochaetales bacterium]